MLFVLLLLQDRQGEARRGSGALQVPLQRDKDHGCDPGLRRACSSLQADGEERHVCFGEPDEGWQRQRSWPTTKQTVFHLHYRCREDSNMNKYSLKQVGVCCFST